MATIFETKFIVFIGQLLMLLKFCHSCRADGSLLQTRQFGYMANPKCLQKEFTWHSQPVILNSRMAARDFLHMSILLEGGSVSKVFQIFRHMGLECVSLNTFFKNQKVNHLKLKLAGQLRNLCNKSSICSIVKFAVKFLYSCLWN